MAIRDPFNHEKIVDLTDKINIIPNVWGLYQQLGLFTTENKSQREVRLYRDHEQNVVMKDSNWDGRRDTVTVGKKDTVLIEIPHFNLDDDIRPNDLYGVADWDSIREGGNNVETLNNVRMKKMETLRKAHSLTLERARAELIREGSVYAPRGTVDTNFYDLFGLTRESLDVGLASTTVDPHSEVLDILSAAQDSLMAGDLVTNWVALCSPSFFKALLGNVFIREHLAALPQAQSQGVLMGVPAAPNGFNAMYQKFDYAGITFILARGAIDGYNYVEEGNAYLLPLGTDTFRTMFAPANLFRYVNQPAQESYFFEYWGERDDKIEIQSESNFLNAMVRPQAVKTLVAK